MKLEKEYDYSKLYGRIHEKYKTKKDFATALGISENSLYSKLNNKVRFTQDEMSVSMNLLNISTNDIYSYFFTEKDVKYATSDEEETQIE